MAAGPSLFKVVHNDSIILSVVPFSPNSIKAWIARKTVSLLADSFLGVVLLKIRVPFPIRMVLGLPLVRNTTLVGT
jgi:hypothetical protein